MTTEFKSQDDLPAKWDLEYRAKGIPSSISTEPSGSLEDAVTRLERSGLRGGLAVDIGCGTGRNSLYLADRGYTVVSMDFVPRMVSSLQDLIRGTEREKRIFPFCQSVSAAWPMAERSRDLAVDMFCFKHLVTDKDRSAYISELERALAPSGHFLLTLAGQDDGYYGPLPRVPGDFPGKTIVDPENSIPSALYEKDDIESMFSKFLFTEHYEKKVKTGWMHGSNYVRTTHVFLMRRID